MRRIRAIYSLALLGLTACAATPDACPAVKQYSVPEQQAIVKEWNALPDNSALLSPLQDWERMRRQLR